MSAKNIRTWSMLGQSGAVFGLAMPEIAKTREDLLVLTADMAAFSGLERFKTTYPDRFFNTGIAEQNMIGMAAGLAAEGYAVLATAYASFITMRSFEQVRDQLGVAGMNIKLFGTAAGSSVGPMGISHYAVEDLALMRLIPKMQVYAPADAAEAIKVAEAVCATGTPVYVRLTSFGNCPVVFREDFEFVPGKGVILREGKRLAVIACGTMTGVVLKAADQLREEGTEITVIHMPTVKPLDTDLVLQTAGAHDVIVTAEDHLITGGLGSAVAETLAEVGSACRLVRTGFHDRYPVRGTYDYVLQQSGLDAAGIAKTLRKALS